MAHLPDDYWLAPGIVNPRNATGSMPAHMYLGILQWGSYWKAQANLHILLGLCWATVDVGPN